MHHRVNCILLFSIKGQTGQNTTVIPHLRSHLHSPHFFYSVAMRQTLHQCFQMDVYRAAGTPDLGFAFKEMESEDRHALLYFQSVLFF